MNVILVYSACQDNMHVSVGAKCMSYACQNKGSTAYTTGVIGVQQASDMYVSCELHDMFDA